MGPRHLYQNIRKCDSITNFLIGTILVFSCPEICYSQSNFGDYAESCVECPRPLTESMVHEGDEGIPFGDGSLTLGDGRVTMENCPLPLGNVPISKGVYASPPENCVGRQGYGEYPVGCYGMVGDECLSQESCPGSMEEGQNGMNVYAIPHEGGLIPLESCPMPMGDCSSSERESYMPILDDYIPNTQQFVQDGPPNDVNYFPQEFLVGNPPVECRYQEQKPPYRHNPCSQIPVKKEQKGQKDSKANKETCHESYTLCSRNEPQIKNCWRCDYDYQTIFKKAWRWKTIARQEMRCRMVPEYYYVTINERVKEYYTIPQRKLVPKYKCIPKVENKPQYYYKYKAMCPKEKDILAKET